ncbi:hypothetical protein V1514DRAFT_305271 [Lipomyces japonicus]|uniref:uncharacterized protein n=1 Tax=Lipomyces japonicus TaxID=56871 RepID=UPI0034CD2A51
MQSTPDSILRRSSVRSTPRRADYYAQRTTSLPSAFPPSPVVSNRSFPTPGRPPSTPAPFAPRRPPAISAPKPAEEISKPLISEQYIDVGSQRFYALSLFALIQAWKLYDLTRLHGGSDAELAFAFRYIVIEGLYFWALPVFKIPWLTFTPTITIFQIVVSSLITIVLSSISALPLVAFISGIWRTISDRELSVSETRVRQRDIVHSADHISGRHIVHILPESTAKLNPFGEMFCLDSGSSALVHIPIRLNATEPKFIQVWHVNFDDVSSPTLLNYTKRDLRKMTHVLPSSVTEVDAKPSKMLEVKVPVKYPGLYRLAKVVDTSNLDVRLYPVDVIVAHCPKAYIRSQSSLSPDRCIGGVDSPYLTVDGVPPLRVKYSRSIKGRDAMFSVQSIQPDYFESPLNQGKPSRTGRIWNANEILDWANTRTVPISLDTSLGTVGRWSYTIDEVEDGLGNLVNYSKLYADTDREQAPELTSKGLNYGFLVHPRPTVRFSTCSPERPVNLPKGKTLSVPLQLSQSAEGGPYNVGLLYTPLDSFGSNEKKNVEVLNVTLRNGLEKFIISKPGTYTIDSINGKYCGGDILESASCVALMPSEPTLSVSFEDIEDKCAGSIGVTADLTLTGTPPFEIRYQVIKDVGTGRQVTKPEKLLITKTRHQLQFRPDAAGHYVYEFFMLADSLYHGIKLDPAVFRAEQTVKVLASASFAKDSLNKRCCIGDTAKFDVNFHGMGPFTLSYEILHGNKRKQHTISDIVGPTQQFTTPPLSSGGSYIVVLLSVEDGNGCKSTLSEQDARIEVKRQRPAAAFAPIDGKSFVRTLQGRSVNVPLRLSGEAPWKIKYAYKSQSGEPKYESVVRNHANGDFITVNQEGVYEIIEIEDDYCPGTVPKGNSFELSWIEQPRLELANVGSLIENDESLYVRDDICEGEEDALEVALFGAPPFSVAYERKFQFEGLAGKPESFELQAVTKFANIRLDGKKPGTYKYTFKKISDAIYSDRDVAKSFKPIVVQQRVRARPDATFVNPGKIYKSCVKAESEDSSIEPINFKFTGEPPFSLTVNIKHENTGQSDTFSVSNIDSHDYSLRSIHNSLGLGRHIVTIKKVSDGRGCSRTQVKPQQVVVSVADIPTITPVSSHVHYCVGDRISYVLTGVPPFEIEYEFNGKRQRATTHSSFTRIASDPGNFTITSIADGASHCKVYLHGDELTKIIHDVPTVKVSEGTSIIQDIHEGDRAEIVFKFSGTPPYSFTYTRSEKIGRSGKERVVETHTVADVHEDSYSIWTSMEGVYEAMSIEDRYCKARLN